MCAHYVHTMYIVYTYMYIHTGVVVLPSSAEASWWSVYVWTSWCGTVLRTSE